MSVRVEQEGLKGTELEEKKTGEIMTGKIQI